eukprot:9179950-Alexandrium_andersonii.AAC.1
MAATAAAGSRRTARPSTAPGSRTQPRTNGWRQIIMGGGLSRGAAAPRPPAPPQGPSWAPPKSAS